MENGKRIKSMGTAHIIGWMAESSEDSGSITICTALVSILGLTGESMWENT